jgi:hypothetical protein
LLIALCCLLVLFLFSLRLLVMCSFSVVKSIAQV